MKFYQNNNNKDEMRYGDYSMAPNGPIRCY